MPKPRRRIEVEIKLGADSRKDAADLLIALASDMRAGGGNGVTGGSNASASYKTTEDETITHDGFHEALRCYLDNLALDNEPLIAGNRQ